MPDRTREPVQPADPPLLPLVLAGTGIWAVAGLVLLAAGAPERWLWTCLAGFLLGLPGSALLAARDRRRREPRQSGTRRTGTGSTSVSS